MKPTLSYLVPTNRILQDSTSTKFTAIDVFSLIWIPKDQPFTLQSFSVLGRVFNLSLGQFKGDVKIIDPSGVILQTSTIEGDIKGGDLAFAAVFNLVKIEKEGKHFIRFSVNGRDLEDGDRYFIVVQKMV